jgi:hypothetical protein
MTYCLTRGGCVVLLFAFIRAQLITPVCVLVCVGGFDPAVSGLHRPWKYVRCLSIHREAKLISNTHRMEKPVQRQSKLVVCLMRNHPQKGPYPTHNAPGTRCGSSVRSCALCLIKKKKPRKLDSLGLIDKNARTCIWPVQLDCWLSLIVQLDFARLFAMRSKQLTALLVPDHRATDAVAFAVADGMSQNHSSPIYCFLHVHGHSKIECTFKLFEQYAWLATNCLYPRISPQINKPRSCSIVIFAVFLTFLTQRESSYICRLPSFETRRLVNVLRSSPACCCHFFGIQIIEDGYWSPNTCCGYA